MNRSCLKKPVRILTVFTLVLFAALMFSVPLEALEIVINKRTSINNDIIRLEDIATFNPSSDSRVANLKSIEISVAPRPDADQRISKDLILYKVSPYISNEKDINISVPESLSVYRNAQVLSSDTITQIFTDHIISSSPWETEKISFERITAPESLSFPVGSLDWDVEERLNSNYVGNVTVTINFRVNGELERKVPVSGRISVARDVVRALKRIRSGEIISAEDLVLVTEKCVKFQGNVVTDMNDVVGKRAVRTIQADNNILYGMVEDPPMVQKGDRVIIKAENNEIRITASGQVLEDGRPGELVRVVNINSGKELYATVRRPDLVEVSF